MDDNKIIRAIDSRRAIFELSRAISHLSSDDFLELPLDERRAHAAAYSGKLPELEKRIPNRPYLQANLHLLGTLLQSYE